MSLYGVRLSLDSDDDIGVDTYAAYGLFLLAEGFSLGSPELKSNLIDVPAMDGSLDASDVPQGYPVYNNRPLSFRLGRLDQSWRPGPGTESDWQIMAGLREQLMQSYHGRRVRVTLPSGPGFYYVGRLSFGPMEDPWTLSASASVYPYALAHDATTADFSDEIDMTERSFALYNGARYVIPSVTISAPVELRMEQGVFGAPPAIRLYPDVPGNEKTFYRPEMLLLPGKNLLRARLLTSLDSALRITWRSGVL